MDPKDVKRKISSNTKAVMAIRQMPMYYKQDVSFPIAESLALKGINLPSYHELNESDVKYISEQIKIFFSHA